MHLMFPNRNIFQHIPFVCSTNKKKAAAKKEKILVCLYNQSI